MIRAVPRHAQKWDGAKFSCKSRLCARFRSWNKPKRAHIFPNAGDVGIERTYLAEHGVGFHPAAVGSFLKSDVVR